MDKYEYAKRFNAIPEKGAWTGIVAIPIETGEDGKCLTPCPYKEKTPSQHIAELMREQGVEMGSADDCAKVGSTGCGCCFYNCGHPSECYGVLLCGKEANKTLRSKAAIKYLMCVQDLHEPRKID